MAQTAGSEDLKEAPWVDVIRTAVDDLRSFVQQEIRLVSSEVGDKVKQAGMGAGMFGAAGFMGFLAAGALTAALILGLSLVITPWLAALAVAVLYGAIAGVLAMTGKSKVAESTPLVPEHAIQSIQDTKDRMQQAWQQGGQQAADAGGSNEDTADRSGSYRHIRRGSATSGPPRY
jgi:hypothetical protein